MRIMRSFDDVRVSAEYADAIRIVKDRVYFRTNEFEVTAVDTPSKFSAILSRRSAYASRGSHIANV